MSRKPNAESKVVALRTPEAAAYLNLQPQTLEQWRWLKKGPTYIKMGRAIRYRIEDLNRFMETFAVN